MKKQLCLILSVLFLFLLGACSSATTPDALTGNPEETPGTQISRIFDSAAANRAEATLNNPTENLVSPLPTGVVSISPMMTPIPSKKVEAHPLALNESNIHSEMALLARFGRGNVYDVKWSPDGKYLAMATGRGVLLYDADSLEEIRWIDVNDAVTDIAFNPGGSEIAVVRDSRISVWNVASGLKRIDLESGIDGGVWRVSFGGGGYIAAVGQIEKGLGTWTPEMKVWDSSTGKVTFTDVDNSGWTHAIAVSPDGKHIAYLAGLYTPDMKELVDTFGGGFDAVFSQDGTRLFTTNWDWYESEENYEVRMIDIESGQETRILSGFHCPSLSRAGKSIISYGKSEVIFINPMDGSAQKTIALPYEIYLAAVSANGDRFAVIAGESVYVWDVEEDAEIARIDFDCMNHFDVGILGYGDSISYLAATSIENGVIKIWDLASGEILHTLQANERRIDELIFLPDQQTLASIDADAAIHLWDIEDGEAVDTIGMRNIGSKDLLLFSPDGKRMAVYKDNEGDVFEVDLRTGESVQFGNRMRHFQYTNPDDPNLITVNHRYPVLDTIFVTNVMTGDTIELPYDREIIETEFTEIFAITMDEQYMAAGTFDGQIYIWDLSSRVLIHTIPAHTTQYWDGGYAAFRELIFSPQNNLLVSVGWDGTTKLWNIHTGNPIRVLNVCCFAEFSPDGRFLITAGTGVIRLWGVPPWPE